MFGDNGYRPDEAEAGMPAESPKEEATTEGSETAAEIKSNETLSEDELRQMVQGILESEVIPRMRVAAEQQDGANKFVESRQRLEELRKQGRDVPDYDNRTYMFITIEKLLNRSEGINDIRKDKLATWQTLRKPISDVVEQYLNDNPDLVPIIVPEHTPEELEQISKKTQSLTTVLLEYASAQTAINELLGVEQADRFNQIISDEVQPRINELLVHLNLQALQNFFPDHTDPNEPINDDEAHKLEFEKPDDGVVVEGLQNFTEQLIAELRGREDVAEMFQGKEALLDDYVRKHMKKFEMLFSR